MKYVTYQALRASLDTAKAKALTALWMHPKKEIEDYDGGDLPWTPALRELAEEGVIGLDSFEDRGTQVEKFFFLPVAQHVSISRF